MKTRDEYRGASRLHFLLSALFGGGLLLAALPADAGAYVVTRSTGCTYPNNNWEVKWAAGSIPVTYKINQNGTPDCDTEFAAVQNGFQAWEDECRSNIDFTYGGVTALDADDWGVEDLTNIVVWAENNWDNLTNDGVDNSNVIAINAYWYACADGHLTDSDIIMNGEDYTWSCSGEAGKMDVYNVATHESGHSLSLFDLYGAGDVDKTMYGIIANGETKKRSLAQDDRDGVAYLYPVNANERVYIRDATDDYACQPYPGATWWHSPDVWMNPEPPVLGQQTVITVRARNMMPTNVQASVTVEVHDPSVSLSPGVNVLWTATQNNVTIAPGYSDVTFNWTPNANSFGQGHYCLIAIVTSGNDNTQVGVPQDNNVTCHNFNITVVAPGSGGSSDECVTAGNNTPYPLTGFFHLDRSELPMDWYATVLDPYGQPYQEGSPVFLAPYTETFFRLIIVVPATAGDGATGTVQFFGIVDPPPPDRPPLLGGVGFQVRVLDPASGIAEDRAAPPIVKARAYPNPFRPPVTLAFQIPRRGRISVDIFDAAHRCVATLMDEPVDSGPREIIWDGRDAFGRPLPSGTYFYQVRLDGERQGGRLLLLK